MGWEPLPSDVAEWMGMDLDMLPFALDLAGRPAESHPPDGGRAASEATLIAG